MQEYSFKPAIIRRPQVWALKDGHLVRRGADMALDLSKVERAVWGDITHRGIRSAWLYLTGPDGVTKIQCNDAGDGNDRTAFLELSKAICETLARVTPDLAIRQDGGAGLKWSMFLIGLIGGLCGLVFVWAGVTGNVKRGEMQAILLGGILATGLLYMAWSFAPWRGDETLTPAQMAASLSGMIAPNRAP